MVYTAQRRNRFNSVCACECAFSSSYKKGVYSVCKAGVSEICCALSVHKAAHHRRAPYFHIHY